MLISYWLVISRPSLIILATAKRICAGSQPGPRWGSLQSSRDPLPGGVGVHCPFPKEPCHHFRPSGLELRPAAPQLAENMSPPLFAAKLRQWLRTWSDSGSNIAYTAATRSRIFGQNPRIDADSKFRDPHISDHTPACLLCTVPTVYFLAVHFSPQMNTKHGSRVT